MKMADIVRAAGLLVYRFSNGRLEYLLLQASYPPYHWTPPKGHVDSGEDEWTAALRETKEEAGIDAQNLEVDKHFSEVLSYTIKQSRYGNEETKQASIRSYEDSKTVKYWLAKLKDSSAVKLSDEHQTVKWAPVDEAVVVAHYPEMGELIRKAEQYLSRKKKHSLSK